MDMAAMDPEHWREEWRLELQRARAARLRGDLRGAAKALTDARFSREMIALLTEGIDWDRQPVNLRRLSNGDARIATFVKALFPRVAS